MSRTQSLCPSCGYDFVAKKRKPKWKLLHAYLVILFAFVWIFAISIAGATLEAVSGASPDTLIGVVALGGFVCLFLGGTTIWAMAKGHPPGTGFLLG